jgi:hypothetical protein
LDELGTIAEEAIEQDGAASLDGFDTACLLASFWVFVLGDIERYQRLRDLARSTLSPPPTWISLISDSVVAMFAGDFDASAIARQAVDVARSGSDPGQLVWSLSHYSVMESVQEHSTGDHGGSEARAAADEALRLARTLPGSLCTLYPLAAKVNAESVVDPARALHAADEAIALDRTQRRWWATIAASSSSQIRATVGTIEARLPNWRAVLVDHQERGERFMLSTTMATMGDVLAASFPAFAADVRAIAESGAIAPVASFTVQPNLIRLSLEQPELVAAARARASVMSFDDAMQHVFAAIEAVLAEHEG